MDAFNQKKTSLINTPNKSENAFVRAASKAAAETQSGNGALKYSTSGNAFVDQFSNASNYLSPRTFQEVSKDMAVLWGIDPLKCVKLTGYLRMVTRDTQVSEGKKDKVTTSVVKAQRGQGLKNEGIMRMLWLAINHTNVFIANFPYLVALGSWKDVITMMSLDLQYHGWEDKKLPWWFLRKAIFAALTNPQTSELVKKYLPNIRTNSRAKTVEAQADTLIGRYLAVGLYGDIYKEITNENKRKYETYRAYCKMKSSGTAHEWQQVISKGHSCDIDFDTIPGKALSLLVHTKFLKNQGLEAKYKQWIANRPVAKFTGFVHELFEPFGPSHYSKGLEQYREMTINAQFKGLVEQAKKGMNTNSSLLVVRDISGSMTGIANGTKMSAYAIGKAMALYFSELLQGPFAGCYAEFADKCQLVHWKGNTPVDKWKNDRNSCYGSTNFLAVAKLFVDLRVRYGVSENEFPQGALCVSDGEFNSAYDCGSSYYQRSGTNVTNFKKFREILVKGGFSKEYAENFKLILWDLPNGYYGGRKEARFEDFADAPNNFYMSGYDPASIAFILGTEYHKTTPKNAAELMNAALDQELLNKMYLPNTPRPVMVGKKPGKKPQPVSKSLVSKSRNKSKK